MKPDPEKYNHITKEFSRLVDDHFHKLDILYCAQLVQPES